MLRSRSARALARICSWSRVVGLDGARRCVRWQVFGRYVLNDTPTWAESLALLLVLYVTMFGVRRRRARRRPHRHGVARWLLAARALRLTMELLIHVLIAASSAR